MIQKIARTIFTIMGLVLGYIIGDMAIKIASELSVTLLNTTVNKIICLVFSTIVFGLILYLLSPFLYKGISKLIDLVVKNINKLSATELIFGTVGIIISLLVGSLAGIPVLGIHPLGGPVLYILIDLIVVIFGTKIFVEKREELFSLIINLRKTSSKDKKPKSTTTKGIAKVLDTSVIIDGRIFDICKTGFVEGPLIIPNFVLDELRHISDSADSLKRSKGRRGLDILNKIQKELDIETQIWEGDFPEIAEVDSKLLKLSQKLKGKVVTNDFNLNKVAEVQGVPVLNINELANAIKPVLIPGEEMKVLVIKDGKEPTQGVAYLEDGTMIVVEGGKEYMGKELLVVVTSVLQTAAGRMIFAKPKES